MSRPCAPHRKLVRGKAGFVRRASSTPAQTLPSRPLGASLMLSLTPSLALGYATSVRLTDLCLMQVHMAGTMEVEPGEKTVVAQVAEELCGLVPNG